jgi:transposase
MGKIRKTYSKEYKLDVVKKYLDEGWTKREIMDQFHISSSMLHRWVTHYKNEGIQGLEEKRARQKGYVKVDQEKILSPLNKNWNVYVRRMNIKKSY